jgi:hypothetical protein
MQAACLSCRNFRWRGWVECLDVNVLVFGRFVPAIPVNGLWFLVSKWNKLYHPYFASKYCLEEVADRALSGYFRYQKVTNIIPDVIDMGEDYEESAPNSEFRKFNMELTAYGWLNKDFNHKDCASWSTVMFCETFKEDNSFMLDVLKPDKMSAISERQGSSRCSIIHLPPTFRSSHLPLRNQC